MEQALEIDPQAQALVESPKQEEDHQGFYHFLYRFIEFADERRSSAVLVGACSGFGFGVGVFLGFGESGATFVFLKTDVIRFPSALNSSLKL